MQRLSWVAYALAVLLPVVACAADRSADLAERYSVGNGVGATAANPSFTLLDPAWLLPSLEWLDTAAALEETQALNAQLAHDAAPVAGGDAATAGGPLSYSLSQDVSAQLNYRRSFLFDTARSDALRVEGTRSFSNRPDRDVVGLNMSWHLADNTLGLGYQIESARGGPATTDIGLSRFLPGNQQATHAITLGLTHEWGRAASPALVEAPIAQVDDAPLAPTAPAGEPVPDRGERTKDQGLE